MDILCVLATHMYTCTVRIEVICNVDSLHADGSVLRAHDIVPFCSYTDVLSLRIVSILAATSRLTMVLIINRHTCTVRAQPLFARVCTTVCPAWLYLRYIFRGFAIHARTFAAIL